SPPPSLRVFLSTQAASGSPLGSAPAPPPPAFGLFRTALEWSWFACNGFSCLCVCVCEREREGKRKREGGKEIEERRVWHFGPPLSPGSEPKGWVCFLKPPRPAEAGRGQRLARTKWPTSSDAGEAAGG
uniref:Uncharacterized protein n=1 Tax=Naja naja TaxID=35670 RepID=A0A8C7E741_NAJNA